MKFFDKNISVTEDIYDAHIGVKSNWFGDVPPFTNLEFNIAGFCNRKCFFCPKADRTRFPNLQEYISLEFYEAIMRELAKVNFSGRISFCGLSEPLFHKQLEKLIRTTKTYCPNVFLDILTNGDILTVEKARELFAAGLDNMKISMYDGPWQIESFEKIRKECGLNDKQFVCRERYLSKDENFGLTINNRGGAVNLTEYNIVPLKKPLKKSCYYPFHKLIIDYNGDVQVCPNDPLKKALVGNLFKDNIFEIWNSKELKEIRLRLANEDRTQEPCIACDVEGTLYAKNHFKAWMEYYDKT